jgi:DNA/RNA-binding domain of Phe-tRNA-synthetase-like protein
MSMIVAQECACLGLQARAAALRGLRVADSDPAIRAEIKVAVQALQQRFAVSGAVCSIPEVVGFQDILRRVGVNPRKEQPSVERLLNYALKRGDLPAINSLVDAYNLVSVRSLCSLGAHDLDRIALPVMLRLLSGEEMFTPLGQDKPVTVVRGEFGYVDSANRVLCRLDLLQAEFSKVTTATVNALLIVEGTPAHSSELLERTRQEAIALVTRACGGSAEVVA